MKRTIITSTKRNLPEFIDGLTLIEYDGSEAEVTLDETSELCSIDWANTSSLKKENYIDTWCDKFTKEFKRSGIDFLVVNVIVSTKPLFKS